MAAQAGGVWLLLGPEVGEKEAFIRAAIESLSRHGAAPEVHRLYAFDTSVVDAVSLLRNGSLFSSHRVVILAAVEQIKAAGETSALVDYCSSPASEATLFLLSDEASETKLAARLVRAIPKERRKVFWEMFEGRKTDWVKGFFRRHGLDIDTEAVAFILEMVENNTRDLEQECSRIAQFLEGQGRVSLEDVQGFLAHNREENVFSLFDRLAARDLTGCLEVLAKILLSRESDPPAILAGLAWQVRRLDALHALLAENYRPEEALAKLAIRARKAQKTYLTASRNYSKAQTEALLALIADTDHRVRTGRAETQRLALELLLYKATQHQGARAARLMS